MKNIILILVALLTGCASDDTCDTTAAQILGLAGQYEIAIDDGGTAPCGLDHLYLGAPLFFYTGDSPQTIIGGPGECVGDLITEGCSMEWDFTCSTARGLERHQGQLEVESLRVMRGSDVVTLREPGQPECMSGVALRWVLVE